MRLQTKRVSIRHLHNEIASPENVRPTEALCRPRYAASGEAGEPGKLDTDEANDASGGDAMDAGMV